MNTARYGTLSNPGKPATGFVSDRGQLEAWEGACGGGSDIQFSLHDEVLPVQHCGRQNKDADITQLRSFRCNRMSVFVPRVLGVLASRIGTMIRYSSRLPDV
ncbi:hypothetical protein GCM10010471_08280 [Leucobacter komagatae]